MLNPFKKKQPVGDQVTFKIEGMHCSSCAMNIDDSLEELAGVHTSDTSYAKGKTTVTYDATKITPKEFVKVIESLDYTVKGD